MNIEVTVTSGPH